MAQPLTVRPVGGVPAPSPGASILTGGSVLSVEEALPDGRRRVLDVREVPADTAGPVRFAMGRYSRPPASAPRPPADDLLAVAFAVGVVA
jgi:hypothetical protein